MSLFDLVRELPLHVDGYYLEPLEREVARDFVLRRTVVVLHGRGEEGRGEDVDYDPHAQQRVPGGRRRSCRSTGGAHARVVLAAAVRADRVPALGVRVGRARPRAAPGRAVARRSARTHAEAAALRRLDARRERRRAGSSCTPTCASSSTRTATGRTRSIATLAATERRDASTSRGSTAARSAHRPMPELYRRVAEGVPRRVDRGPGADGEPTSAVLEPSPRRGSPGMRRSTSGATSRRCRSSPHCLNCKPSRFGSVKRLFDFYDRCKRERDRAVRRRPVRARRRARADPAARVAVPRGRAERRRARRATTPRSLSPGSPVSPLAPPPQSPGFR